MRIAVIGAGPVGMLVVSSLVRNGRNPGLTWVVRRPTLREKVLAEGIQLYPQNPCPENHLYPRDNEDLSQISDEGYILPATRQEDFFNDPYEVIDTRHISVVSSTSELLNNEYDLIIACVKAYDLTSLKSQFKEVDTLKVFVTNGYWLNPGLDLGILFGGGYANENKLSLSSGGTLAIGRVKSPYADFLLQFTEENSTGALVYNLRELSALEELRTSIDNELLSVSIIADIYPVMLRKAIVNCVINPLSALTLSENRAVVGNYADSVVGPLLSETFSVLKTAHFIPPNDPQLTLSTLLNEIREVSRRTGSNLNSMLVDVLRGRPTEMRFLNQVICSLGTRYGVPTPISTAIVQTLDILEGSSLFGDSRENSD